MYSYTSSSSSSDDYSESDSDIEYDCPKCYYTCVEGQSCHNCHIIAKRTHTDEPDCGCYICDERRVKEHLDKLPHGRCISCQCDSLKFFMTADTNQIAPLCANCMLVLIDNHLADACFPIEMIVKLTSESMRVEAFCVEYLDYILPENMNTDENMLFSILPRELFSLIRDNIYDKSSGYNCHSITRKEAIKLEKIEKDWVLENYAFNGVDLERFAKSGFFYGRINGLDNLSWYISAAHHRNNDMPVVIYGNPNWFNFHNADFDGDEMNVIENHLDGIEDYSTDDMPGLEHPPA